mgnify:CR=1 FL=1
MGLDVSHDCWSGACSAFNRWRFKLAELADVPLPLMVGFTSGPYDKNDETYPFTPIKWSALKPDILHVLLDHSDCDGIIAHKDCLLLASRLEELLPQLGILPNDTGHIGNWAEKTQQFIDGLRFASANNEDIKFY